MSGVLSDKVQAIVVTVSLFLIAVGASTPPDPTNAWFKWGLTLLGIAGIALKEGLGAKS